MDVDPSVLAICSGGLTAKTCLLMRIIIVARPDTKIVALTMIERSARVMGIWTMKYNWATA